MKRTNQERGGYFRNVSSETELGTFEQKFFCERFFYLHVQFNTSSTVSSFICFFPVTEGRHLFWKNIFVGVHWR